MSGAPAAERLARAALSYLAEPGDSAVGLWLRACGPESLVAAVRSGCVPAQVGAAVQKEVVAQAADVQAERTLLPARNLPPADGLQPDMNARTVADKCAAWLGRAMRNWRARLAEIPTERDLAATEQAGIRILCPGDSEWPTQLDALCDARPYALWVRGAADLRLCCLRSVSVVGARAATAYGAHVASELAAALATRGWAIVSGGAYGIDGAAHRATLAADGMTVVVLASGVDDPYPQGHQTLFDAIAAQGLLVSEWPPGRHPTRHRFLVRNRVIAALSRGTVVVEARQRSGALSTARYARDLCRPLMAVPGPITSEASAGCHRIMREWGAVCVTGADDVIEQVGLVGEHLPPLGAVALPGELDSVTACVLEAVPARGGAGPATVAASAGVDLDTAVSSLGLLAVSGLVVRGQRGWRLARSNDA